MCTVPPSRGTNKRSYIPKGCQTVSPQRCSHEDEAPPRTSAWASRPADEQDRGSASKSLGPSLSEALPPLGGGGGILWPASPRRYRVPGQPLLNRHQVGGVSRSPDGLFAQQEREPTRGRPAVRGGRTYGGRPGQRVEEQGTWASQEHSEAGYGRPVDRGVWTA